MLLTTWLLCLLTYIFFGRYFIVLANTSVFTFKHSNWAWPQFTWHSFVLWAMRMRLGTIAIALRLGQMAGNPFGRVHCEVFGIATAKSGIVMTVSLFNEIWPYFSLVEIGRSWNSGLQEEYGRNNRIQMLGYAYQIFVADVLLFRGHSFYLCVLGHYSCIYNQLSVCCNRVRH